MAKDQYGDQTRFITEEPVFEDASAPVAPVDPHEEMSEVPAGKKNKKKLVLIGVIGFVLIVVFVLLLVLFRMSGNGQPQAEPEEEIIQVEDPNGEVNTLLNEVKQLQEELEEADPSSNTLPFPPVDMGLRLDPAPRR